MATLLSEKIGFRAKSVIKDKEGYYINAKSPNPPGNQRVLTPVFPEQPKYVTQRLPESGQT